MSPLPEGGLAGARVGKIQIHLSSRGAAVLPEPPGMGSREVRRRFRAGGVSGPLHARTLRCRTLDDRHNSARLVAADPSLAIFAAAMQGDTRELDKLLAGNRSLVSALSSDGWTPLHLAALFGRLDAVRVLIEQGAQVAARSDNAMENTPLHAAAAGRPRRRSARLLIDCGASANARKTAAGRRCMPPRRTAISNSRGR